MTIQQHGHSRKTIFISHAGADKPRLGPFVERILERTISCPDEIHLWIDRPGEVGWPAPGPLIGGLAGNDRVHGLVPGLPWSSEIAKAVNASACVVVFYSDRAAPEKNLVFANEIVSALFAQKCVTLSLDPYRKREKPDMLLDWIQWTDVSRYQSPDGDDGAFDRAIDQILKVLYPESAPAADSDLSSATNDLHMLRRFKEIADRQRAREMELLSSDHRVDAKIVDRKYIADIFVERRELSTSLSCFHASDSQTYVMLGAAGMGKTSFMCASANEFGRDGYALFYLAIELHGGLKASLESDLEPLLAGRPLQDALVALAKAAVSEGRRLTVFIDGLNEFPGNRSRLRAELNELVRQTEKSGLHWVVSCRTLDWDYWLRNDNNMIGRFGRSIFSDRNDGVASAVANEFDAPELDIAWKKYQQQFGLVGQPGPQLRGICREPFMLRLVAEVYRDGKPIPPDIDANRLFSRYFSERFPDQKQLLEVNRILLSAAKRTLDTGVAYIEIVGLSGEDFALCQVLMQENVLVQRGDTHLYFRFELVLEYILSRWITSSLGPASTLESRRTAVLDATLSPSVNIFGAVENILISWQLEGPLVADLLMALASKEDDRWKIVVCSAIEKMDQLPPAAAAVKALAGDGNFVVRRYLAKAAASHDAASVAPLIKGMVADERVWERRETAANILRSAGDAEWPGTMSNLFHLADDYHWRVRRAAGYALHDLWRAHPSEMEAAIDRLEAMTWRQRHAMCIGLSDQSSLETTSAGSAIARLARDDNHQVRWMVANYLQKYSDVEVAETGVRLANDADEWVRGRTAAALVALPAHRRSSQPLVEALSSLTSDRAVGVRVRMARELEKIATESWAQKALFGYLTDEPEVSFAAAYSLGRVAQTQSLDLFGDHPASDVETPLWIVRERIARGDVDTARSRFGALQNIISRGVDLPAESDRYMRMIDSMCSLVAAGAEGLAQGSPQRVRFFDLLSEDVDESVRWALVLYQANFAETDVSSEQKLKILARLAGDAHFWVRREVALALARWPNGDAVEHRVELLETMWKRELAGVEPCKDEVLHYLSAAFRAAGVVSTVPSIAARPTE